MSRILQPYEIGLAYADVSSPEAIVDVIYALNMLSSTVDDVFSKVESRIANENSRLTNINGRIDVCEKKVKSIIGTSNAITVFSTAKYPAPKILPVYPALFHQVSFSQSLYREASDDSEYNLFESKKSAVGNSEASEELNAIVARVNSYGTDIVREEFVMEDEGIGKLPFNIPSIGSMLLFNSNISPYQEYQTLDNLVSSGRDKIAKEDEKKASLASAPMTMLSGEALPDIAGMDLTFKPEMGQMSSLSLPANLPLDFLAADVQFAGVALPSIAPSTHLRGNYSLPQITNGGPSIAPPSFAPGPSASQPPLPPSASSGPPPPPPSGSSMPTATAPPPPPPSESIVSSVTSSSLPPAPPVMSSPVLPESSLSVAPIPIAPPSSIILSPPPSSEKEVEEEGGGDGGGRAGLLDAIRSMNKIKLRSKDESIAVVKPTKKLEEKRPLSLQDDLKARLMRRNNAISGKSDKEQQRRDSLIIEKAKLDLLKDLASGSGSGNGKGSSGDASSHNNNKISSMAPPTKAKKSRNDSDDSEDDDDDDSRDSQSSDADGSDSDDGSFMKKGSSSVPSFPPTRRASNSGVPTPTTTSSTPSGNNKTAQVISPATTSKFSMGMDELLNKAKEKEDDSQSDEEEDEDWD